MKNHIVFKYFSGSIELAGHFPIKREIVRAKYPAGSILKFDDFSLLVGTQSGKYDLANYLPVTRRIKYNELGSKHKCDARCQNAKGPNCECACQGANHGAGNP